MINTSRKVTSHAAFRRRRLKSRAWATVNKETGGGNKSGSGRDVPDTHVSSKKGGKLGGAASPARSPAEKSASAKKAAATRKKEPGGKAAKGRFWITNLSGSRMSKAQSLRLGMFVMPIHDPAKPLVQCIDEDLELAVQCEELGFDDFWVGEHHSSSVENIVMPEIFLAKVLGMTECIRIGPAPVCLQYHHPVHVAGRLAFLDHMSHGRLNVCFGPGAIPTDMEVFGAHASETSARVAESIDMILRLWTGDLPIDIEGRFWNVKMKDHLNPKFGVGHLHKPFQRPHPPIYVPSISRTSAGLSKAAERGFRFISHHMIHTNVLQEQWKTYSQAAMAAGRTANHLTGPWHETCSSRTRPSEPSVSRKAIRSARASSTFST